jgi:hypothetical protein
MYFSAEWDWNPATTWFLQTLHSCREVYYSLDGIWKCWDQETKGQFPLVLLTNPNADLSALFACHTLQHTKRTLLGLDFCCPWVHKLEVEEYLEQVGVCHAHRLQSSLGPAMTPCIEASKVSAALKLTLDWPSPKHTYSTSLNSVDKFLAVCFLLSRWY